MQIRNQGQKQNKMPSTLFNIDFGASISLSFIAWHVPSDMSVLQCCHSWHSSLERTNRTPQNGTKTAKQDNIPEASFNKKYSAGFYTVGSTWKGVVRYTWAERNKHVMFLDIFNGSFFFFSSVNCTHRLCIGSTSNPVSVNRQTADRDGVGRARSLRRNKHPALRKGTAVCFVNFALVSQPVSSNEA